MVSISASVKSLQQMKVSETMRRNEWWTLFYVDFLGDLGDDGSPNDSDRRNLLNNPSSFSAYATISNGWGKSQEHRAASNTTSLRAAI